MLSVLERKWLELEAELKVSSFRSRQATSQFVEKREELLLTIDKAFEIVERLARVRAKLKMRENNRDTNE
ncbi:hypothetical protein MFLAVUS_008953 [Mucor flavus]|uniref:50S ribosomal protein L29 n=1 Tax=Mucor flavus TaxID=439312 RepID=A0ABP9Z8Q3_9FUNG